MTQLWKRGDQKAPFCKGGRAQRGGILASFGRNDNIRQQGMIRLEQQGDDVYFTYIPHFSPQVTALSNEAGHFTERELSSACSFVMNPKGDGFAGNTLGSATCALAMRGAVGKWSLEVEPGMVVYIEPYTSTWFDDYRGVFLYKEITGDYIVSTRVRATGKGSATPTSTCRWPTGSIARLPA
jgi:hypothetical protein